MFDYGEAINDTAVTIFLNFYKTKPDTALLTSQDATDLMTIISSQYDTDVLKVERDISKEIKSLVNKMPQSYIYSSNITIH